MATLTKYLQTQNFSLAGSGVTAGATSIILKSFKGIDGVLITNTDLGALNFATLEPGNGTQEEQISFTGVTQNVNGTATLTGVSSVTFITPYTATSGTLKTHPGSTTLIITNTSGFYDKFPAKDNDETITGTWTFNVFPITPATPTATTTTLGMIKTSVAPASALSPIAVETTDPRVPVAYAVDAVGTDSYAITPSPAITAYAAGQHFTFKAGTANTGACSLNVSGLGAKTIKKNVSGDLVTGDILLNQIVEVIYDGTNMQMLSVNSVIPIVTTFNASGTWTKPSGLKYVLVEAWGGGGSGGASTSIASATGGGGGAYFYKTIVASLLGATETVTVGAGGTAVASNSNGVAGGNSSFGSFLTVYGGARGGGAATNVPGGGGGGGISSAGSAGAVTTGGAGGNPIGGAAGTSSPVAAGGDSIYGGGGGGDSNASSAGGQSVYGGGGGGGSAAGGNSYYGGGGGGGIAGSAGGTSVYGGNGGAGADTGTAVSGSAPGGGGGGVRNTGTSGAGAAGRIVVSEFY